MTVHRPHPAQPLRVPAATMSPKSSICLGLVHFERVASISLPPHSGRHRQAEYMVVSTRGSARRLEPLVSRRAS
jgi:hypothetical protein